MKIAKKVFFYWLPPIIWMIFIFYLSSQKRISVTQRYVFDFVIFKALHMIEYSILYFLFFRAFYSINKNGFSLQKKTFYPVILSIFYAVVDEVHQTFVPTREGKIRDVIIDSIGIFLIYIYIKKNFSFIKKIL